MVRMHSKLMQGALPKEAHLPQRALAADDGLAGARGVGGVLFAPLAAQAQPVELVRNARLHGAQCRS